MPAWFSRLDVEMEENVLGMRTHGPSRDGGCVSWQDAALRNGMSVHRWRVRHRGTESRTEGVREGRKE